MKNTTRKRNTLSKLQRQLNEIDRIIKDTESLVKLGTFSGNASNKMLNGFKAERHRLVEDIDTKLLNVAYPELKNLRRSAARATYGTTRRRFSF
jgi:hypothetical protein